VSSPEKAEKQVQTAIRVPASWLVRLDKIAERLSQPGMRVTRAEALRVATARGIVELEAETKKR
jgi:predicted DNA-binding protein